MSRKVEQSGFAGHRFFTDHSDHGNPNDNEQKDSLHFLVLYQPASSFRQPNGHRVLRFGHF